MRTENVVVQNALLLFVEVESLIQNNKLDNEFEEFQSLIISAGLIIKEKVIFKQKNPIVNTFVTKGKLEKIKTIII